MFQKSKKKLHYFDDRIFQFTFFLLLICGYVCVYVECFFLFYLFRTDGANCLLACKLIRWMKLPERIKMKLFSTLSVWNAICLWLFKLRVLRHTNNHFQTMNFCLHFMLRIFGVITFFLVSRFHFGMNFIFFPLHFVPHTIKCE